MISATSDSLAATFADRISLFDAGNFISACKQMGLDSDNIDKVETHLLQSQKYRETLLSFERPIAATRDAILGQNTLTPSTNDYLFAGQAMRDLAIQFNNKIAAGDIDTNDNPSATAFWAQLKKYKAPAAPAEFSEVPDYYTNGDSIIRAAQERVGKDWGVKDYIEANLTPPLTSALPKRP